MINKKRLLSSFLKLVEINSPSRGEGAVATVVAAELTDLGFDVQVDDAGTVLGGETGNVVATLSSRGHGRHRILLCSHMDTVQSTDGIKVIQDSGVIRQTGAAVLGADDKGGIAAILEGIRAVIESGDDHGQLQVAFLICEEIGLLGAKHLDMSMVSSDFAYVFDSGQPVGHLVSAAPTHDNLIINFRGRAAHAGVCPEEGASAIVAASRAINSMKLGRIDAETTANVGVITGGSARNIIPEKCDLRAEARSLNTAKLDAQVSEMRVACESAASETDCEVTIQVTREYLGYTHSREDNLIRFALKAANSIGMNPELLAHGGGSDCNIMNARGLPTVVTGVGYEKIHTPEEYIAISDLERCAEFVEALVRTSGAKSWE